MQHPSIPYPWQLNGEGLCPVLRDPELLRSAFEKAPKDMEFVAVLGGLTARANPLFPSTLDQQLRRTPRGRHFGSALVKALGNAQKRKKLFDRMAKALKGAKEVHRFLAQHLYDVLKEKYPELLPATDDVCVEEHEKSYLDSSKFKAWLWNINLAAEHYRPLSLFACAFAILQPREASQFLRALLDRDAAFKRWLMPEKDPEPHERGPQSNALSNSVSGTQVATEPSEDKSQMVSPREEVDKEWISPDTSELVHLLEDGRDWTSDISLEQCRKATTVLRGKAQDESTRQQVLKALHSRLGGNQAITPTSTDENSISDAIKRSAVIDREMAKLLQERFALGSLIAARLRQKLQRNEGRLQELDDALDRLRAQLQEVAGIPWVERALVPDKYLSLPPGSTLSLAQELVDIKRRDVSRILQADSSLKEVVARLREGTKPLVADDVTTLGDVAAHLEGALELYKQRFREIAEREKNAATFLGSFQGVTGKKSARRLILEAPPESVRDLAIFLVGSQPCTEAGNSFQRLVGRTDLAGLIIAHLWTLDRKHALSVITLSKPERSWHRDLLAFLSFPQLQDVAIEIEQTAPIIAELIYVTALRAADSSALAYLEPLLDIPTVPHSCVDLYRVCLDEWRSGGYVSPAHLIDSLQPQPPEQFARSAAAHRQQLLELIRQRPSLTHNYYKLRVLARKHFLEPLNDALTAGDAARAWREWQEGGNLDDMVEQCVARSGLRKLDRSHYQQTRRYFEGFETKLREWSRLSNQQPAKKMSPLKKAMAALRHDAEMGQNPASVSLFQAIRTLSQARADQWLPPLDFGQRFLPVDDGDPMLLASPELLGPLMTWSWPEALEKGAVPMCLFLGDEVRQALGTGPISLDAAVEEYWQAGEFTAAQKAVESDAALHHEVSNRLEKKRSDLYSAHSTLIQEAENYRAHDDDIDLCLQEIQSCLKELQFQEAVEWFGELDLLVQRMRTRRDPIRLSILEYLREGGLHPREESSREELQRQLDELRRKNELRRLHIQELEKAGANTALPELLRNRWLSVARAIDRPSSWPTDETAFELGWAVQEIVRFLEGQIKGRDSDLVTADLFLERFAEWLPERLDPKLEGAGLTQVRQVATDLANRLPERRILQQLGSSAVPSVTQLVQRVSIREGAMESPPPERPAPRTRTVLPSYDPAALWDSGEVLSQIRDFLWKHIRQEALAPAADERLLREASVRHSWSDSRRLAAALIRRAEADLPPDRALDIEAAYAVALAYSADSAEEGARALGNAALTVMFVPHRSQCEHFLSGGLLDNLAARAILALVPNKGNRAGFESRDLRESLSSALKGFVELSPSVESFRQLADLLWKGGERLPSQLWESLRGLREVAEPRGDLLILLYRLRLFRSLEHLSEQARPFDDLIRDCIKAAIQAEADPALRAPAREIFVAFQQQAEGKKNHGPWVKLFCWIEKCRSMPESSPIECELISDYLTRASGGIEELQVRLAPSMSDPPRHLEIELRCSGTTSFRQVLLDEEPLLRERVFSIDVPPEALATAGNEVEIAYRLCGRTIFQTEIDIRRSWQVPVLSQAAFQLEEEEIRSQWPGAAGDPVNARRGFHGREEEYRQIDLHLRDHSRQRSVMLIGQRRIGKTSLLLKMVESMPPRRGAICGAFLDIGGLTLPPGRMNESFFDALVTGLDTKRENQALREALGGERVSVLGRGLRPDLSLADALEALVEKMRDQSKGRIERLALFIDEFDKFVEPMHQDQSRREEVEKLQWNLRQIVQRSHQLSLILAGTGLQRLFTEDYQNPFYGSIEKIDLKPFDLAKEQNAIAETFVPKYLRDKLCPGPTFAEVATQAYALSGGHPWYLAMLGCASARVSGGHRLTAALLRRAAELMLQGRIPGGGKINERSNFYGYDFESLKRLPKDLQAIAHIVLTFIAQRTSAEFPWLPRWQALEHPRLMQLTSEDKRQAALKSLLDERVLELDSSTRSQVRVRVLLTAEAIRLDSLDILDKAFRQLQPK